MNEELEVGDQVRFADGKIRRIIKDAGLLKIEGTDFGVQHAEIIEVEEVEGL